MGPCPNPARALPQTLLGPCPWNPLEACSPRLFAQGVCAAYVSPRSMQMRCVFDFLLKVYMLRMSCVCAAFVLRMSCVCPAYVTPCSRLALQEVDNKNLEYEITVLEETLRQKEPNMSAIKEYMIKVLIVYFCFFSF